MMFWIKTRLFLLGNVVFCCCCLEEKEKEKVIKHHSGRFVCCSMFLAQ